MASKKAGKQPTDNAAASAASSSIDELMLAALERGGESMETGRYLVTFKEGAVTLGRAPLCRDLGFALGPRVNAGGRVGKSDLGVRLLTCDDPAE